MFSDFNYDWTALKPDPWIHNRYHTVYQLFILQHYWPKSFIIDKLINKPNWHRLKNSVCFRRSHNWMLLSKMASSCSFIHNIACFNAEQPSSVYSKHVQRDKQEHMRTVESQPNISQSTANTEQIIRKLVWDIKNKMSFKIRTSVTLYFHLLKQKKT